MFAAHRPGATAGYRMWHLWLMWRLSGLNERSQRQRGCWRRAGAAMHQLQLVLLLFSPLLTVYSIHERGDTMGCMFILGENKYITCLMMTMNIKKILYCSLTSAFFKKKKNSWVPFKVQLIISRVACVCLCITNRWWRAELPDQGFETILTQQIPLTTPHWWIRRTKLEPNQDNGQHGRQTCCSPNVRSERGSLSTLPQLHSFHTNNIHPYPTHFRIFSHSVWIMCSSTTTSVSVGKALRILLVDIAFS